MKKILLFTTIIVISLLVPAPTKADNLTLRICQYVQTNDKSRLRAYLKQNKLKVRKIYDGLRCNGDNLLIFSAKSNAIDVGKFIIGKLPSKKVKPEIENLAKHSVDLAQAAQDR